VSEKGAKEKLRSAPWLKTAQLTELQDKAPDQVEARLKE
jgi:hypothetical protein